MALALALIPQKTLFEARNMVASVVLVVKKLFDLSHEIPTTNMLAIIVVFTVVRLTTVPVGLEVSLRKGALEALMPRPDCATDLTDQFSPRSG